MHEQSRPAPSVSAPTDRGQAAGPQGGAPSQGNAWMQETLRSRPPDDAPPDEQSALPGGDWIADLLAEAPPPEQGGGAWADVIAQVRAKVADRIAEAAKPPPAPEEAERPSAPTDQVSERGAADLQRLSDAASRPWYAAPRGKCYRAVAGFDSSSYMNRAGGRWKQLADRIPGDHGMWAVSFAHWLQATRHGQQAAAELGFTILESDGRTRLGDYLAARPHLKGAIVVVPYGQEGTASREWNAAAHYGDKKWGAGVGDISVVTRIGEKGATYVADGPVPHDNATMWWIVHPK